MGQWFVWEKESLQTSVATLMLVTAAVVLCCIVINYSVTIAQQTANNATNPYYGQMENLTRQLSDQTTQLFNQTQQPNPGIPTP